MLPAAIRLAFLAALVLPLSAGAEPGLGRALPSRPAPMAPSPSRLAAPLAAQRFVAGDYVSLREAAGFMGMRTSWQEKERRLTLSDGRNKVVVEADSREANVDGLRLFLGRPAVLKNGVLYVTKVDFERTLLARVRPGSVPAPPPRPRVIALDPGHGGSDNGMENKRLGLKEKILTLDVAERLQKILVARGYKVVLTRTDDRPLARDKPTDFRRRSDLANRAGADLFVSIHFNSLYPDTRTSGTETYTFTPQSQRSDRAWSPLEADDTEREPVPVNRYDPWSALLGQMMHREVIASLKTLDRGQKTMHSAILRGLNCPGVLVESIFLSNETEATRAATPQYRQQIAEALAAGIEAYSDAIAALHVKPARASAVSSLPPS
ncbi:MAG: N-acetylmuramoyl-L-alanine amidase [Verrucomicrobia bacterium]|nr:N-acetylmuramoyl-L-alanine amidase [Verrucomicrobiota bacterium]